jgi:hypothetical protein
LRHKRAELAQHGIDIKGSNEHIKPMFFIDHAWHDHALCAACCLITNNEFNECKSSEVGGRVCAQHRPNQEIVSFLSWCRFALPILTAAAADPRSRARHGLGFGSCLAWAWLGLGFGLALTWLWLSRAYRGLGFGLAWLWIGFAFGFGFGLALAWLWLAHGFRLLGFGLALAWLLVLGLAVGLAVGFVFPRFARKERIWFVNPLKMICKGYVNVM